MSENAKFPHEHKSPKYEEPWVAFDEFKLFYESAEKVTDRRLETNRWNYSICVAILLAAAAIGNWSLKDGTFFLFGGIAICVLSAMAILFCALWIAQIRDFKKLNNAKFGLLNEMAPRLEFDPEHPGKFESFLPLEKEWKRLGELNATEELSSVKIVALKSSNIEYFIPRAFQFLFIAVLMAWLFFALKYGPPHETMVPLTPRSTDSNPNR